MEDFIPITESQKIFVTSGVFRAVTLDMPEVIEDNNLKTSLGSGQFRWNFIIRNLSNSFEANFETITPSRGCWKLLLLRDLVSNFSLSIMSERNFRKLRRSSPDRVHYLPALISENKERASIENQLCLDGFRITPDKNILSDIRTQLLSAFSGMVTEHILVLFDYDFTGVTSMRAVLLTPDMKIAVCEDWTKYLKSTFVPVVSILGSLFEDDEPIVKLKPEYEYDDSVAEEHKESSGENNNN